MLNKEVRDYDGACPGDDNISGGKRRWISLIGSDVLGPGAVTIGAALRAGDGTPELRSRSARVLRYLELGEEAVLSAYETIPAESRRVGDGEDYQDELDAAFKALPGFQETSNQ